jgi:cytochrome bd-type quinol oxidase subunit 2
MSPAKRTWTIRGLLVLLVAVNLLCLWLTPVLQAQVNSHLDMAPVRVLFYGLALGMLIVAGIEMKRRTGWPRVAARLAIALSLAAWGYHFQHLMCEGCLNSG